MNALFLYPAVTYLYKKLKFPKLTMQEERLTVSLI